MSQLYYYLFFLAVLLLFYEIYFIASVSGVIERIIIPYSKSIVILVLILDIWSFAGSYRLLSIIDSQSFKIASETQNLDFVSSIYFSAVTFGTVGYGDITPLSRTAKLLTTCQILLTFFYLIFVVTVIASNNAIYSEIYHSRNSKKD
jgi:hypothetical protein